MKKILSLVSIIILTMITTGCKEDTEIVSERKFLINKFKIEHLATIKYLKSDNLEVNYSNYSNIDEGCGALVSLVGSCTLRTTEGKELTYDVSEESVYLTTKFTNIKGYEDIDIDLYCQMGAIQKDDDDKKTTIEIIASSNGNEFGRVTLEDSSIISGAVDTDFKANNQVANLFIPYENNIDSMLVGLNLPKDTKVDLYYFDKLISSGIVMDHKALFEFDTIVGTLDAQYHITAGDKEMKLSPEEFKMMLESLKVNTSNNKEGEVLY